MKKIITAPFKITFKIFRLPFILAWLFIRLLRLLVRIILAILGIILAILSFPSKLIFKLLKRFFPELGKHKLIADISIDWLIDKLIDITKNLIKIAFNIDEN